MEESNRGDNLIKDVEAKLKGIFDDVNKWLTFAEAKNGAMIALNGAILAGLANILFNKDFNEYFNIWVKMILYISVACTAAAIVILLISFLPQLSVFKGMDVSCDEECVLIYYGDIAKYKNEKQYIKHIYHYYFNIDKSEDELSKIEIDYGKEIIINSSIAVKKLKWFKLALKFTISAVITPIPVIIALIVIHVLKNVNSV